MLHSSRAVSGVALLVVLAGVCVHSDAEGSSGEDKDWWKNALVYQVYPRSFMDANNDGVGDLEGITSKLEHLADIGVTAVWLSPIYPSPQVDFGYDISDFTDIDKQYGSLDDFDKLQKKCKALGLKLVLDFVPNHCSDKHDWFQNSIEKKDKYTNYFIWEDPKWDAGGKRLPPNNWRSVFRGSAWTWNEKRQQYYLHQFTPQQPDLNLRNEDVLNDIDKIYEFWAQRGVEGFRIDAAPFLVEDERLRDEPLSPWHDLVDPEDHAYLMHDYTQNLPETYKLFKRWRKVVDGFNNESRVIMAEAYGSFEQVMDYYGTREEPGAHFPFNFFLMTNLGPGSKAADFKKVIDDWMGKMDDFHTPNWVLGNHDQKRVATRFGPEMADTMNMISLTLPGISVTYYGEEIGMQNTFISWDETLDPQALQVGENGYLEKSRDPVRTPFQWSTSDSTGFSKNLTTWLPVNPNYWWLNLEAQKSNKKSHYHVYKALTEARKEATLKKGDYSVKYCCSGNNKTDSVLIIKRKLENEPTFILVANLGSRDTTLKKEEVADTDKDTLKVWVASSNTPFQSGEQIGNQVILRAKGALLLTTGKVRIASSATSAAAPALLIVLSLLGRLLVW